jgi:large subunit ribosomal protein L10
LARPEKENAVAEIKERVANSRIAIMTKYVGVNVEQVTDLRKRLRDAGAEYKVYKNTLARRALRELELEQAADFMEGPTAWAFCEDPVAPAKVLKEFSKQVDFVGMQGGILVGEIVSPEKLQALADLPPRDVLLAQTVGTIAAPLRNFVGTLQALPRNLVNVLDQVKKQKEEAGEAA